MRHQKAKNRKIGCKNNQMYLFLTGNSHFVECSFWFWVLINSFQTALDQRTTISSLPPKKGWRNCCHPDFFQYSCGFPGFLRSIFQNRPTVDVQPPKEQKQHKTAFLLLHRKAVFSFFRRRQRNDFRLSVRVVLGFDRGRRRWGLTGSRDGRND